MTLVIYGSFNFRSLRREYAQDTILASLGLFHVVYVYESFHAGGADNTITVTRNPQAFAAIARVPGMTAIMTDWNAHLLRRAEKAIAADKRASVSQRARRAKLHKSLRADAHQLVLADIGLALSRPSDYAPVRLCFSEYLTATPMPGSSEYLVRHLGRTEIVKRLESAGARC